MDTLVAQKKVRHIRQVKNVVKLYTDIIWTMLVGMQSKEHMMEPLSMLILLLKKQLKTTFWIWSKRTK